MIIILLGLEKMKARIDKVFLSIKNSKRKQSTSFRSEKQYFLLYNQQLQQMKGKRLWKALTVENPSSNPDFSQDLSLKHNENISLDMMIKKISNSNKKSKENVQKYQKEELQYSQVVFSNDLKHAFSSQKEQNSQQPLIMSVDTRTYTIQSPNMEKWLQIKSEMTRLKIIQEDVYLSLLKQTLNYRKMMEQVKAGVQDMFMRLWQEGRSKEEKLKKILQKIEQKDIRIDELQNQRRNIIGLSDIIENLEQEKVKIHHQYKQQIQKLQQTIDKLIVEKDSLNQNVFYYQQKIAQIEIEISEKVKHASQRKVEKIQKKYKLQVLTLEEEIQNLSGELLTKTKQKQIYQANYKAQVSKLQQKQEQVRGREIQLEKNFDDLTKTHRKLQEEGGILRQKKLQLEMDEEKIKSKIEELKYWEQQLQEKRTYRQQSETHINSSYLKKSGSPHGSIIEEKMKSKASLKQMPTFQSAYFNSGLINQPPLPHRSPREKQKCIQSRIEQKYNTSEFFNKRPSENSKLLGLNAKLARIQKQLREQIDSIK